MKVVFIVLGIIAAFILSAVALAVLIILDKTVG